MTAYLNVCNYIHSAFLPSFVAIYLMSFSALETVKFQQNNLPRIMLIIFDAVLFNRERSKGWCLSLQVLALHYLLFDTGCGVFDPTLPRHLAPQESK